MKSKRISAVLIAGALLGVGATLQANTNTVSVASWGPKELYTVPKVMRGTWYYKESGKIKKTKITAHSMDGRKLYKQLPSKEYSEWFDKLHKLKSKEYNKAWKYLYKDRMEASDFKWHGHSGFVCRQWLAGASGTYITPAKRTRYGVKTRAVRFGGGAGNWLSYYAYPSRKLAK